MLELVATAKFTVIARREAHEQWFGRSMARLTKWAESIDWSDPAVRVMMAPHVRRLRRSQAAVFKAVTLDFHATALAEALPLGDFESRPKRVVLATLLDDKKRRPFAEAYDKWMLDWILPRLAGTSARRARYQRFPCIRIHRPGELTIGPHCDAQYNHHPSTINVVVSLTPCRGTACLVYETEPGKEDWRVFERGVLFFVGGSCGHFTTENTTADTRLSIDTRVLFNHAPSSYDDGSYFVTARLTDRWRRIEDDATFYGRPDPRCGVPFLMRPEQRKKRRRPKLELLTWKEVECLYDVLGAMDAIFKQLESLTS